MKETILDIVTGFLIGALIVVGVVFAFVLFDGIADLVSQWWVK